MKIFTSVVKGRFARALNVLFRLVILTLVFSIGGYIGQITFEPQVIVDHKIETRYRVIEMVVRQTVERVIEKNVYVPVEKAPSY